VKINFNDIERVKGVIESVVDVIKSLEKKDREDSFGKHLIFHIPVDATLKGYQVYTSDGQDLTDYFRIVSVDNFNCEPNKYSKLTLTIEASVG
jgi:hypothetical protein